MHRPRILSVALLLLALLPSGTLSSLSAQQSSRESLRTRPGPERIGDVRPLNLRILSNDPGSWIQSISSPGASFIKVHFRSADIRPGDSLIVTDATGQEIHSYPGAPMTGADETGFWSLSVSGDEAIVRFQPGPTDGAGESAAAAAIVIDQYADGFTGMPPRTADPGQENVCGSSQLRSVACYQGSHPTEYARSRAVAELIISRSDGTYACTGWRLGPGNHMMTNEHCISSQSDVANTEVWFNYQNLECSGTRAPITRVTGDTLFLDDQELDFALFSVKNFETIGGFGYLELDPRTPVRDEEIYIPQHPQARSREFGIESDVNTGRICRIDFAVTDGLGINTDTGYYCDTEPGSSGSPVLARSSHKVIGIHHLGYTNCEGPNLAARMELIHPLIRSFLGSSAQGTPGGWLDQPLNNSVVSGAVEIAGWASVVSGNTASQPNRVELFIDGISAGLMNLGMNRPDVQQFYAIQGITAPANLGYYGNWNSAGVNDGPHRMVIRVSDALGQLQESAANIVDFTIHTRNGNSTTTSTTVPTTTTTTSTTTTQPTTTTTTTLPALVGTPRGWLDVPVNGQAVSGSINIGGWTVIVSGNLGGPPSRIELLIDGVRVGLLQAGIRRDDVQQYLAVQGISAPANLGFSGQWNSATVSDGRHRLSIRVADAAGASGEALVEIASILVVTGNGITTTLPSTTTTTVASTSTTTLPVTTTTAPATTTSTVPTTTASTTTTTSSTAASTSTTTTIPGVSVSGYLDVPTDGQSVTGILQGAGWSFINNNGVAELPSRVDVLIDGVFATQATLGFARPDVVTHFALRGMSVPPNTGFQFSWNSINATPGNHVLSIRVSDRGTLFSEASFELTRITITVNEPAGSWVNIATQDFEGAFPGAWEVVDTSAAADHEYFWGKRDCRAFSGGFSGWGVGGGANGSALACGSQYPDQVSSWLAYGPFSLADASQAELGFKLWLNAEPGYDYVCRMASIDGTNFYGICTSGTTDGWSERVLDLTNIPNLGDLKATGQVWVGLLFTSDEDTHLTEGGFVDNIVLRKCVSGSCPTSSSLEAQPVDSGLVEWPVHIRRPR